MDKIEVASTSQRTPMRSHIYTIFVHKALTSLYLFDLIDLFVFVTLQVKYTEKYRKRWLRESLNWKPGAYISVRLPLD